MLHLTSQTIIGSHYQHPFSTEHVRKGNIMSATVAITNL